MENEVLIVEQASKCKLLREEGRQTGHDCWGKTEWTTDHYVYINGTTKEDVPLPENWYLVHDGKSVFRVISASLLKYENIRYQERVMNSVFVYSETWTPSTEKDYNNPKQGFEYRMIIKSTKEKIESTNSLEGKFKQFENENFNKTKTALDLIEYLKRESKNQHAEFRLVVLSNDTAYIHVPGRDSETFNFKL